MRFSCLARVLVRLVYAALTLLAAGLVGGGGMLVLLLLADMVMTAFTAGSSFFGAGILVGMVAYPFWLTGAFIVGPPLWAALHAVRLTGRRTALSAGALAASIAVPVVLWMLNGGAAPSLSPESFGGLGLLTVVAGASGALAGEVIHRLAYRSGSLVGVR